MPLKSFSTRYVCNASPKSQTLGTSNESAIYSTSFLICPVQALFFILELHQFAGHVERTTNTKAGAWFSEGHSSLGTAKFIIAPGSFQIVTCWTWGNVEVLKFTPIFSSDQNSSSCNGNTTGQYRSITFQRPLGKFKPGAVSSWTHNCWWSASLQGDFMIKCSSKCQESEWGCLIFIHQIMFYKDTIETCLIKEIKLLLFHVVRFLVWSWSTFRIWLNCAASEKMFASSHHSSCRQQVSIQQETRRSILCVLDQSKFKNNSRRCLVHKQNQKAEELLVAELFSLGSSTNPQWMSKSLSKLSWHRYAGYQFTLAYNSGRKRFDSETHRTSSCFVFHCALIYRHQWEWFLSGGQKPANITLMARCSFCGLGWLAIRPLHV